MSFESYYWKKILKKYIKDISVLDFNSEKNFEKNISMSEIKIFSILYGIRKMSEYHKIGSDIMDSRVKVKEFDRKRPGRRIIIDLEKDYDLKSFVYKDITFRILCNQFIHSKVFEYSFNKNGVKDIFFASDREFKNRLYSITFKKLLSILEKVLESEVSSIVQRFDTKGDIITISSSK